MRIFAPVDTKRYSYETLEDKGELEFIFKTFVNVYMPDDLAKEIRLRLKECQFDPVEDAISFSGPALIVGVFAAVVAAEYGTFNALLFDSRLNTHHLRKITLGEPLAEAHETNESRCESVEEPNYNV